MLRDLASPGGLVPLQPVCYHLQRTRLYFTGLLTVHIPPCKQCLHGTNQSYVSGSSVPVHNERRA